MIKMKQVCEETGLTAGTFPYGGLRYTWQEDEEIKIAWDEKRPGYLLPLEGAWLKKKAFVYVLLAFALVAVSCLLLGHAQTMAIS